MNLGKALPDAPQHLLVPINLEIGMQSALHQNAGSTELDRFANLVVNGFEIEDVSFFCLWALERPIEGAKGAVLGAEIRVVNIAVDDVSRNAFGMQLAPYSVGFHANANQVIG